MWQSRPFWEFADKILNADGELLRLHDAYRAAQVPTDSAPVPEVIAPGITATVEAPPIPAMILIVWTDGAITEAPMTRETR